MFFSMILHPANWILNSKLELKLLFLCLTFLMQLKCNCNATAMQLQCNRNATAMQPDPYKISKTISDLRCDRLTYRPGVGTEGAFFGPKRKPKPKAKKLRPSAKDLSRRFQFAHFC